jgi:hypothetical protein
VEAARRQKLGRLALYALGVFGLPLVFFLISLRNVYDYGETSDEAYDQAIGRFYYEDYPKTGFADLDIRLDPLQRNYGAFWDVVDVWSGDVLMNRTGWVKDETAAHHVSVIAVSTLLLGVIFLLGTRAYGLGCGFASQLALLLMPQFIGHSQNNLKDQPVSFFFALAMLGFLVAWRRGKLAYWVLAGALGGAAYAVKINGIFVLPVAGLWMLPFVVRDRKRIPVWLLRFALASAAFVAMVPLLWPYYRTHTVSHFVETVTAFRLHVFNEVVYYMGRHAPAREVPWHFPFVMFAITTPLVLLALALVGFGILVKLLAKKRLDEAGPLLLFSVWLVVPIVTQVASGVPRCDGVRHYLYLLPALALLAGTGAVGLWRWADERRLGPRGVRAAVFALPALLLLRTLVVYHPYEVVFFNSLVGGPAGASRNFELDYWGTSLLEASRWIDANLPKDTRLWFTQPGFHRFKFKNGPYYFVGPLDRPNYKVSLLRGMVKTYDTDDDYLHPRRKAVYEIKVQGAPILQIFAMEENTDVLEGATLVPPLAVPTHVAPGLKATLSVDNKPPEEMPPQERLFIDCANNPYRDRSTELLASGYLHVTTPGRYLFELFSDDCATIWLGKDALISNVSTVTTRREVVLSPGYYPMRVKYRNEMGEACLAFRWQPPGATGVSEVTAPALLHESAAPGNTATDKMAP